MEKLGEKFIKTCRRCSLTKPLNEFYKNRQTKDGVHSHCIECSKAISKIKRETRPEEAKLSQRKAHLKHTFGITHEDYESLLKGQKGVCAICKQPSSKKQLAVDHNHSTGEVRGLLCQSCNTALGLFKDNPSVLETAINYLNKGN